MDSYAYYNGKFGKRGDISIPLSDRSVFFGDAIYEAAIGCYDRIMWEEEHIDRLLVNARKLSIHHRYTKKDLSAILHEAAVKSCIDDYLIYFSLSRSSESRVHSALKCENANLLITIEPFEVYCSSTPVTLTVKEDLRYQYCDIKTVNLLPNVTALTNAEKNGFDEVVFHRDGIVTECAKSNISIIKQGRLITHPLTNHILPGITRHHILEVCKRLGTPFSEGKYTLCDMYSADEIIISSSSKLCRKVRQIDGISVGGRNEKLADKICSTIFEEYENCIKNSN